MSTEQDHRDAIVLLTRCTFSGFRNQEYMFRGYMGDHLDALDALTDGHPTPDPDPLREAVISTAREMVRGWTGETSRAWVSAGEAMGIRDGWRRDLHNLMDLYEARWGPLERGHRWSTA